MADYYATARSNYFRVRDLAAFREDFDRHGLALADWDSPMTGDLILDTDETNQPEGSVALFAAGSDHGTWPFVGEKDQIIEKLEDLDLACNSYEPLTQEGRHPLETYDESDLPCDACGKYREEHTDTRPYAENIEELVSRHLIAGDVAVFMEAGAEKFRYVGGAAVAVNSHGETVSVNLDDIYDKAADLGESITAAGF